MRRPVEFFRHCLGPAEVESVTKTLGSIFITLGPRVGDFEAAFAALLGVEHVVGLASCSMSLVLALRALGIGPGDEVITTPMTFVATPNAALQVGARPVFADIDPRSGLIDPEQVEAAITPRTRAIVAVGLYGQLADHRALRTIADRHRLRLIDDAAHSIEATADGIRTAALPDATAFSFYATKNLTCGDGGALAVHDPELCARLKSLRNHGITKDAASRYGQAYRHWDMLELGYKAALNDIQAAILLPQLPHLEVRRARRQALVERYEQELKGHEHIGLVTRRGTSAHHLFTVQVPATIRDDVLAGLGRRQIGCAVNYRAVHTLRYFRDLLGHVPEDFPHAAGFGDRTITLPLFPDLAPDDVSVVVGALDEAVREALAGRPAAGGAAGGTR
ncbi:MAG: DegT/DnrJ/EryC1/StrS family aminotransferase [Polyangiaceae bacterium]|nr:DegT/DnrJ/EryC1/StrS family aminotransferase [Polyangiaceae bacterium]